MSETVERRLLDVLGHPTVSPYGNPIPGLEELGEDDTAADPIDGVAALVTLDRVSVDAGAAVVVCRLAEPLQGDTALMSRLRRAGVRPGQSITVATSAGGLLVGSGGETTEISPEVASHVFVAAPS
jgi:DtxR family Mn-dependent transcriptional regulator